MNRVVTNENLATVELLTKDNLITGTGKMKVSSGDHELEQHKLP